MYPIYFFTVRKLCEIPRQNYIPNYVLKTADHAEVYSQWSIKEISSVGVENFNILFNGFGTVCFEHLSFYNWYDLILNQSLIFVFKSCILNNTWL